MLTFDRILLASDFSASAEAALRYAAALAHQSRASLLVMHVIETRVAALPRWTDVFRSAEVFAAMEAASRAALQRLLTHPALAGLPVETMVQHGHPYDCLVDMAPRVDLVVMGTSGQGAACKRSTGKVARQVAHACPVPVLLVPPGGGQAGLPALQGERLPWQCLLLALHPTHYAPQALALWQALASVCGAARLALQVIEPDKAASYSIDAGTGMHHNLDALKIVLAKRLAEVVPDDPPGPPLERLVLVGRPAEVMMQQIAERRVDLVVMSVHAYGVLRKFFTPSTVDAILEQAPCPVLAVPFPDL
jgi:nucleotide-binding universal stress UspA family protein